VKILHLCLACFYIDGYNYQENVLPRINKEDGHDVRIIASTETFVDNQRLGYIDAAEYVTEYGVPIKRLPYVRIGTQFSTVKFRKYVGLYDEIVKYAPDVIMSHDIAFWSVLDVIQYKKEHPEVKFYADSHSDSNNSGTNWLSKNVLHRLFYKWLVQQALPYLDKYFYLWEEGKQFSLENYGVPEKIMEFYPLGGLAFSEEEYKQKRDCRRKELGIGADEWLFCHSGKMDALKQTDELIKAFSAVPELKAKLVIIGSIPEDRKNVLLPLIELDKRIIYLGWKKAPELLEYLCACDLYCQPGTMSATMQNSVCCECAVMSYPHESYVKGFDYGNILWIRTQEDMATTFARIAQGGVDLNVLKNNSRRCAQELLDYRTLAARLYR